jgi:streptogramin lyase
VHGGQQPIVGARIYLLAANTTGYGGNSIAASSSNASVSLLNASSTGASDSIGAYVTSGAGGGFSISGDYSCTPDTQVYLYAVGGNAGAGSNSSSALMAVLGNCPASGNFATATPTVIINEVTTVAAAYAFAGFASDPTHVSSSGTALAKTGIKNAFANAANLVDISTGLARATTTNGNGNVPQQLLNTLGNILAACVNSDGSVNGPSTPTACYTLFNNALSAGTSGTVPTNTATAAINIAHNPGANVSALVGLSTGVIPFSPELSATPNDLTVGIEFSGGGLNDPVAIAIDASGYVWLADHGGAGTVTELSPAGVPVSPSGGYVATTLSQFYGIAIDPGGNVWLAAYYDNAIIKMSNTGTLLSGSTGYKDATIKNPYNLASDGSGNIWATNCGTQLCSGPYSVAVVSNSGSILSGANGYSGSNQIPLAIALDTSDSAWVANRDNNTLTKFSSTGTVLSGAGYSGGGLNKPYALAIDHSGNVWVASYGSLGSSNVTEFNSSGSAISPGTGYQATGIDAPDAIAVDGSGQIWVASTGRNNNANANVTVLSSTGSVVSPDTGYQGGNINYPVGIAIDGSGNAWVVNALDSTVTQLIGVAAPVITPLSVGVRDNTLGTKP